MFLAFMKFNVLDTTIKNDTVKEWDLGLNFKAVGSENVVDTTTTDPLSNNEGHSQVKGTPPKKKISPKK